MMRADITYTMKKFFKQNYVSEANSDFGKGRVEEVCHG